MSFLGSSDYFGNHLVHAAATKQNAIVSEFGYNFICSIQCTCFEFGMWYWNLLVNRSVAFYSSRGNAGNCNSIPTMTNLKDIMDS